MKLDIRKLLKCLLGRRDEAAQSIYWSLLFAIAMLINFSGLFGESSSDPIDLPDHVGPRGKLLRIPSAKTTRVANWQQLATYSNQAGLCGEDSSKLFGRSNIASNVNDAAANKWIEPLAYQCLHRLQEVFHHRRCPDHIFSIAWDAIRLSPRDTLMAAIYNHSLKLAGWCPPHAFLFSQQWHCFEEG